MYLAIVGSHCPEEARSRLLSLSAVKGVVALPVDCLIAAPIADHPDSLICIFEKRLYAHSEYARAAEKELSEICRACGLELCAVECQRGPEYPLDCGFNALSLPDRHLLIAREKSLAEPLRRLPTADTRQGYAGCSALYAGGTVITADPSVERTCRAIDVPYFHISGEDISLPGYAEGFIGGAGGSFDDTVCLFGSPRHSKSALEVEIFCAERGLSLVCLEDTALTDRGGIKFIEIEE